MGEVLQLIRVRQADTKEAHAIKRFSSTPLLSTREKESRKNQRMYKCPEGDSESHLRGTIERRYEQRPTRTMACAYRGDYMFIT